MAEQVKRSRARVLLINDRVSVASTHFGEGFAEDIWEKHKVKKILGTVSFKLTGRARIKWDSDERSSEVEFKDLTIEPPDTPLQRFGKF